MPLRFATTTPQRLFAIVALFIPIAATAESNAQSASEMSQLAKQSDAARSTERLIAVIKLDRGGTVPVTGWAGADAQSLVVEYDAANMHLVTRLNWHSIAAVQIGGTSYSCSELRAILIPDAVPGTTPPIASPQPAHFEHFVEQPVVGFSGELPMTLRSVPVAGPYPAVWQRARVIGVQRDPLTAYVDMLPQTYPNGVPPREAWAALVLLRNRRAYDVLGPPWQPLAPPPIPLAPPVPGF